jgi:hypothetical protein
MRSREFLRRLDKLKLSEKERPAMVHDFEVLSRVEIARFCELCQMLAEDKELTETEVKEFELLLNKCPLVHPSEISNPYAETNEERRERWELRSAFAGAFHDYVRQYPYIAVPNYANLLNEYRLDIGYQLFEKYGWTVGERDCCTILPLVKWESEDREG